ncbi:hypothetical protein N9733_04135, partial [Akkermansiaceae bacterium]|nr:hypothetical protein [Akkermansiaceae bacterium]
EGGRARFGHHLIETQAVDRSTVRAVCAIELKDLPSGHPRSAGMALCFNESSILSSSINL